MASHLRKENGETLQPLLLNVPQVATLLGLSRTKVYELIATEGLPVLKFGRAVRVSFKSLQQWLDQREHGLVA
ncbi:MAG: helix-turn-helix domain-containing protein [Ktedonobacteraceae bacterium]